MAKDFLFVNGDDFYEEALAFEQSDFIASSAGVADAGKPVILDAAGQLDISFIPVASIDHGNLAGLSDDDHPQYLLTDGTRALTGDLSMGSFKLTNLADGTAATDAVNLSQLNSVSAGLDPKESARICTVSDIGGTYAAGGGTGGTGAFTGVDLTSSANFDGLVDDQGSPIVLAVGDRILVKSQTTATENGIYVVTTAGAAGAIERAADHDGSPSNEVSGGNFIFVEGGSTCANTGWVLQGDGNLALNTDDIDFIQFSGGGAIIAGDGLGKTGNTLFVNPGDGIEIVSDNVTADLLASGGLKFVSGEIAVEPADFAGLGLEDDGSDNLQLDLLASGGLKFVGNEVAVEPNDFAGTGLEDDGSDNLQIDFFQPGVDAPAAVDKAVDVTDLAANGANQGANLIGADPSNINSSSATTVQGILEDLDAALDDAGSGVIYNSDGSGVSAGDLVYITADNTVTTYTPITGNFEAIGIAETTVGASTPVKVLANDEVAVGVLSGAVAGTKYYWDGSALTTTRPTAVGTNVVVVGIAKNPTDLHVQIRFVKKNN